MKTNKSRDVLRLTVARSDVETLLAQYLRASNKGVKKNGFKAIEAYYYSIAISECTQSTKAQRDFALHQCLSSLKQQMTELMDYHYRLDGTVIEANSFSSVTISSAGGFRL